MMEDCQKKAWKPGFQVPRQPDLKPKDKGNGGNDNKGAQSVDELSDGEGDQPSGEKTNEEVASLFIGAVCRHERYDRRDWQAWEKIQRQAERPMLSTLKWVREPTWR